jgi:hypothetical protein
MTTNFLTREHSRICAAFKHPGAVTASSTLINILSVAIWILGTTSGYGCEFGQKHYSSRFENVGIRSLQR